jgi:dTDP-4-dehydrorhamnose reductase
MKALIFGTRGMLGSALARHLHYLPARVCCPEVDITQLEDVDRTFRETNVDVAINCAGIVKSECHDQERAVAVNARAPHVLADIARKYKARLVHISTDGVFSGRSGNYRENDPTDAEDLYGRTKAAGEVTRRLDCLTIRTSFIGYDFRHRRGLLEWLRQSTGVVPGYTRALWSGLSALELSKAITLAMTKNLSGLYHVSGPPISKADLLEVLVSELGLNCRIERVPGEPIDRTLDGSRFDDATGYRTPTWAAMAKELKVG